MAEEFVRREEFDVLKRDVEKIRQEMSENSKTLANIDKKLDVITERLVNSDKIDELKISPLESRITKLENGISWLWKLCATIIITGIISAIITFK